MSVFIIASISADGFIAPLDKTISSTSWTSREDTKFFQHKTSEAGVVIMGRKTYETIPEKYRPLKNRLNIVYTSKPNTINNSIPLMEFLNLESKILNHPTTTDLNPKNLITTLVASGLNDIGIIGGANIYTQFILADVIDELFLTIEPILFGDGTPLFDKSLNTKLHLNEVIDLSDQAKVLHYVISKN